MVCEVVKVAFRIMKPNFWLYRNKEEQNQVAGSLVAFGAEVATRANVIRCLDILREWNQALQANESYDKQAIAIELSLDYLMDSVRILIFFENYMKAELIVRNFCVHQINKSNQSRADLIMLAKQQDKRPVELYEIRDLESFIVNDEEKIITNTGLKETTIGMNVLLQPAYLEHYAFDDEILRIVRELLVLRNKLHFHSSARFEMSTQFIDDIERINSFIYGTANSLTERKRI
jgi:hypothetical protein